MAARELVGFIVQEIADDLSAHDVLQQARVLYSTWDAAVSAAGVLAHTAAERCSTRATCILRGTSYNTCLENGFVVLYRIHDWRSDVYVFPVYRPAPPAPAPSPAGKI
jgi:hypothetical protein